MSDEQRGPDRPDRSTGNLVDQEPSVPHNGQTSPTADGDDRWYGGGAQPGPGQPAGSGTAQPGTAQPGTAQPGPSQPGRSGPDQAEARYSAAAYGASSWPADPYGGGQRPDGTLVADRPRKGSRPMAGIVAAALIAGLVGGGAGFGGAYAVLDGGSSTSGVTLNGTPAKPAIATAPDGTVAAAAQIATPSTVDIRVPLAQGLAEGSGVVLTADGAVLTNNHVVSGATGPIRVTLADGSEHGATVVGTSPSYDLAVLKLEGVSGLTAATLGRSQDVQVGEQVVAIGSPQGLTGTVTSGIVSALDRTVAVQGEDGSGVVYNGLQTDAPINQGNSGGPLVNLSGQVVGINSAIATAGSQSTGSIGLGFAIPIDQARRAAEEILNTGQATKPVLGVQGSTGGARTATESGATIAQVVPGSPAADAGLAAGDVVTKVGDASVSDFADLVARISAAAPGDRVTLTVTGSDGSQRTVDVTLGSTVDQAATTSSGGSSSPANPFGDQSPFGGRGPFGGGN